MAVLLLKLAAGTLCLGDSAGVRFASADASVTASPQMSAVADVAATEEGRTCVLGEAGGCHCSCAHSVALSAAAKLVVARLDARLDLPANPPASTPAMPGSLIRPPIA